MNIIVFTNKIKKNFSDKTKEELQHALLNITRRVPSDQRDKFLELLDEEFNEEVFENPLTPELEAQIDRIYHSLSEIDTGNLILTEVEKSNDEWNWDRFILREIVLDDPDDIEGTVKEAIALVNQLYDIAEYYECYELGKTLIRTIITIDGIKESKYYSIRDYCQNLSIDESVLEDLLLETAYAAYQILPEEEKAEAIYTLVDNAKSTDFTLKNLMQYGEELEDFDQFLDSLIEFLKGKNTEPSSKLLSEATELSHNTD